MTYGGLQTMQVEPLPGDGLEQVPLAEIDRHPQPFRTALKAANRSARGLMSIAVDVLGMTRGEQGLVAVARAQVERRARPAADGEPGQHPSRRRDAEDVVGPCELVWNASQAISRSSVGTSSSAAET